MHPALLLDRDGVIIENRNEYVRSWSDVSIYPQAIEALVGVAPLGYKIVIITNQSAVGRDLISLETAERINLQLINELESAGGRIDGVYMCPHAPQHECTCRKPQPGLIMEAAESLSLDLDRSILIGDALSDILAGQTAGVGKNVLVRTGRGMEQADLSLAEEMPPFLVYDDLSVAISKLISFPKIRSAT